MKKTRYIIALWLLSVGFAVSAQDRGMVWAHGLNENSVFWEGYQDAFDDERRMFSSNPSLNSTQGVAGMANELRGAAAGAAGANSIAIGHSMGGVALREVGRNNANFMGGIITVGSPMNGARIANSLANGQLDAAVLLGAQDMAAGPATTLGAGVTGFFGPFSWVGSLVGYAGGRVIIDRFIPDVVGNIRQDLLDNTGQSAVDLSEGSAYMQQAIPSFVDLPRISVFGNENSPTLFRISSSAATNGANDTQFVDVANELGDVYDDAYESFKGTTIIGRVWRVLYTTGSNLYIADQWKKGRDYVREYAEADWSRLTGAVRTETVTVSGVVVSLCTSQEYANCMAQNCTPGSGGQCQQICNSRCYGTETRTYTQQVQQPSDAFIHQDSQTGANRLRVQNSAWNPVAIEALGANHLEQGAHPSMDAAFRIIWDRELPNIPDFFATARR